MKAFSEQNEFCENFISKRFDHCVTFPLIFYKAQNVCECQTLKTYFRSYESSKSDCGSLYRFSKAEEYMRRA